MYAKLFSRITESSLMEEPIEVRYTFAFMLAICDATGHVIGTDVAIARRLNMPIPEFQQCILALMAPDLDSNSKEEEGRRVVISTGERGYKLVNYLTYRDMKTQENRRTYMADYMKKYREKKASLAVVNKRKPRLTQAEAEGELKEEAKVERSRAPSGPHQQFIDDWMKYYEKRNGAKYPFGGRDGKAVAILLSHFQTPEDAKRFIGEVHKRSGEGYPFSNADTLYELANNIAKLQAALSQSKNGHAAKPVAPLPSSSERYGEH